MARCTMRPKKLKKLLMRGAFALLFLTLNLGFAQAAELPLVRIAYGAFREVVRSLAKNLRLTSTKEAENGYEVLQWLYSLDIRPNVEGIRNMQRLLAITNPKVAGVKAEDVVYETAVELIQKSAFYEGLVNRVKR